MGECLCRREEALGTQSKHWGFPASRRLWVVEEHSAGRWAAGGEGRVDGRSGA